MILTKRYTATSPLFHSAHCCSLKKHHLLPQITTTTTPHHTLYKQIYSCSQHAPNTQRRLGKQLVEGEERAVGSRERTMRGSRLSLSPLPILDFLSSLLPYPLPPSVAISLVFSPLPPPPDHPSYVQRHPCQVTSRGQGPCRVH